MKNAIITIRPNSWTSSWIKMSYTLKARKSVTSSVTSSVTNFILIDSLETIWPISLSVLPYFSMECGNYLQCSNCNPECVWIGVGFYIEKQVHAFVFCTGLRDRVHNVSISKTANSHGNKLSVGGTLTNIIILDLVNDYSLILMYFRHSIKTKTLNIYIQMQTRSILTISMWIYPYARSLIRFVYEFIQMIRHWRNNVRHSPPPQPTNQSINQPLRHIIFSNCNRFISPCARRIIKKTNRNLKPQILFLYTKPFLFI